MLICLLALAVLVPSCAAAVYIHHLALQPDER